MELFVLTLLLAESKSLNALPSMDVAQGRGGCQGENANMTEHMNG